MCVYWPKTVSGSFSLTILLNVKKPKWEENMGSLPVRDSFSKRCSLIDVCPSCMLKTSQNTFAENTVRFCVAFLVLLGGCTVGVTERTVAFSNGFPLHSAPPSGPTLWRRLIHWHVKQTAHSAIPPDLRPELWQDSFSGTRRQLALQCRGKRLNRSHIFWC